MNVQQISIYLQNEAGSLAGVARTLKNGKINMRVLVIAEADYMADNYGKPREIDAYGELRIIVDDLNKAVAVLDEAKVVYNLVPVLAVEMGDESGALCEIAGLCLDAKISINYAYSFVEQIKKRAILFMQFENIDAATQLLVGNGYKLLSVEEVCRI